MTTRSQGHSSERLLDGIAPSYRLPAGLVDREAECRLIGGVLRYEVDPQVLSQHLFKAIPPALIDAIRAVYSEVPTSDTPALICRVADWLERCGLLDAIGGYRELASLLDTIPVVDRGKVLLGRLGDLAARRSVYQGALRIATSALDPQTSVETLQAQLIALGVKETGYSGEEFPIVEAALLPNPGPNSWIVEGLIPDREVTALYGDGGVGKSFIGMCLAQCVALGQPFLEIPTAHYNTLYVDAEIGEMATVHRAYQVAAGLGQDRPPRGLFLLILEGTSLNNVVDHLVQAVRLKGIGLIVVDSWAMAIAGDPIDAQHVVTAFRMLRNLGAAVLVIDHQPKAPGLDVAAKTQFGSVFKRNLARSQLQAVSIGEQPGRVYLALRHTKANLGPRLGEAIPLTITFEEKAVRVERGTEEAIALSSGQSADEAVWSALVRLGEATAETLAEATGLAVGSVRNILTPWRKAGRIVVAGQDGRAVIWRAAIEPLE